jgi:uncharacterized protein (TIGR01370 family)
LILFDTRKSLRCLSARLLAALCVLVCMTGHAADPAVALFYGANPPWDELRAFDVVVVDPDHAGLDPRPHQHADSQVFAYVSVGEVHPSRPWFDEVPAAWRKQENPAWGSRIIDQSAAQWPAFLADRVIAPLWEQGYRGFFLDTLDSWQRLARTPEQRARQQAGLIAAVRAIKQRFPEARLIFNRGFEILPEVHDLAWMVAGESLFQGHDPARGTVTEVSETDRQWLLARLGEVRERYRLPVMAIDYVAPHQRQLARQTAEKIRALGMIPWVTTPALDTLGVGAIEVLPRKVLVLYNPAESPDVFVSEVQRLLAMPLAYLGLVIEYLPLTSEVPAIDLTGRYAGIVSWLRDPSVLEGTAWPQWIKAQTAKGLPLAVFGSFGMQQDVDALRQFGVTPPASLPDADLRIVTQAPMMGFELPLRPRAVGLPAVKLAGEGKPLLGLQSATGEQWHPAALMPWGGYVLAPYTVGLLPGGNQGERWYINPVAFLRAALRIDAAVPVPDVTTENGRRLFFSHIDGDGFPSQFEGGGFRFAGEVLRDEVLKRYQLPVTLSVIEGEVGPNGLYAQLSPRLEKAARDMYALPWVEAATHTYSHPFFWSQAEAAEEEGYHLAIPGYRFDMAREISGSADYINRNLLPAGKRIQAVFWTGNCVATASALAEAEQAGLLNMNGGETTITRSRNTWTRIAGLGLQRNGHFQVFAPNQNENVYTGNWTGPFYGFDRVIETFELTDRPYRFKPVDLYYHTYSASKPASLSALHRIYAWVAGQNLHPVFASDYIRKVQDFNRMVIARTPDGFRVRGDGRLRTVRIPGGQPAAPDWAASPGLAGMSPAPEGQYLHLSGPAADLKLTAPATKDVYLAEANARLSSFERRGRDLYFGLAGNVPLAFALGNAQGCRLTAGEKLLHPHHKAAGLDHYRLEHHAESAFKLDCGA